jgi:hypothetical protein
MHLDLEIADSVYRFFRALDDADYEACCSAFSAEGSWHRQGKLLQGVDMIRSALRDRGADFQTRHLITNMLTRAVAQMSAEVTFYSTVYAHRSAPGIEPPPIGAPAVLAVYQASLVRESGIWRIESLRSTPTFRN